MRRTLGPLLLTTALLTTSLAGCGSNDSSTVSDQSGTTTGATPSGSGTDAAGFDQIALIGQSGAGGRVDERATVLDDSAAIAAFSRQFRTDAVGHRIESEIRQADVPADQTVMGAVVSIGCDVPPGVDVEVAGGRVTITPMKVESPLQECLVAVTTVALVAVDSHAL